MVDVVSEIADMLMVALVLVTGATEPYVRGSSIGVDCSRVTTRASYFCAFLLQ